MWEGQTLEDTIDLEKELVYMGLLDKAREIYSELNDEAAVSYIKSSYRLLSKVYHPDLNLQNVDRAQVLQRKLNRINHLVSQMKDEELIALIKKGIKEKVERKNRILVVEDEFGLQELFRDIFLMEGYDIRIAVNGDDGYEAYRQFEPYLVFTDVVMPQMNGLELVKKIRKINPQIKVIYISGFFGIKRLKQKLDEDVLKYGYPTISKPFKVSVMLDLVKDYLEESEEMEGSPGF